MRKLNRVLSNFGPGLLLAATGIGVGDMVSATVVGAKYGLMMVWVLAAGVLVKFVITEGLAKWQLATGTTLLEGWRDHFPPALSIAFFGYFLIWTYFVAGGFSGNKCYGSGRLVSRFRTAHVGFHSCCFGRHTGLLG